MDFLIYDQKRKFMETKMYWVTALTNSLSLEAWTSYHMMTGGATQFAGKKHYSIHENIANLQLKNPHG